MTGRASAASIAAQEYYCRKYWIKRISLAEAQRIDGLVNGGATAEEAATQVYHFFNMHRLALDYATGFEPGIAAQKAYEEFCDNYSISA